MTLLVHTHSDRGGRAKNEDALSVTHAAHGELLALADGLGGHAGGADAAQACVKAVAERFEAGGLAEAGLELLAGAAAAAIAARRQALNLPETAMRSTLAMLWRNGERAQWAHVGDSRIYWFRNGVLQTRTRDHSVAELASRLNPDATPDPADRHSLVRALGSATFAQAELGAPLNNVRSGDAFLLCSDGIWGIVTDEELTAALGHAATPESWSAAILRRLSDRVAADDLAGHDNFSLIAAMVVA